MESKKNELSWRMSRIEKYSIFKSMVESSNELLDKLYNQIIPYAEDSFKFQTKHISDHPLYKKFNSKIDDYAFDLAVFGDSFIEKVKSDEDQLVTFQFLPPETMFRIQTVKGKLLEFHQSKNGPDYEALQYDLKEKSSQFASKAIRFFPEQIIHCRLINYKPKSMRQPDDNLQFVYGTSLLEKVPCFWSREHSEVIADELTSAITQLIEEY